VSKKNRILAQEKRDLIKKIDAAIETAEKDIISLNKETGNLTTSQSWNSGEHGSDVHNQDKASHLIKRLQDKITNLEIARNKIITDKTYGLCNSCQELIPFKRLIEVPHAKLCFQCKTNVETGNHNQKKANKLSFAL
jgi:RNA polymerase-binding transcription factor DksA